jgi:hypothetical protein
VYILGKHYSTSQMVMTFFGINFEEALQHMDYVRWFITLLIIWYILFYFCNRTMKLSYSIVCQIMLGLALCLLKWRGFFSIGSFSQILAFPAGCVIAFYIEEIRLVVGKNTIIFVFPLSIFAFITADYFIIAHTDVVTGFVSKLTMFVLSNTIPYCFFLLLASAIVLLDKFYSIFLVLCGNISYELFLIHGALLVKYNFVFPIFHNANIVMGFTVYLMVSIILSKVLNICLKKVYSGESFKIEGLFRH